MCTEAGFKESIKSTLCRTSEYYLWIDFNFCVQQRFEYFFAALLYFISRNKNNNMPTGSTTMISYSCCTEQRYKTMADSWESRTVCYPASDLGSRTQEGSGKWAHARAKRRRLLVMVSVRTDTPPARGKRGGLLAAKESQWQWSSR